MKDNKIEPGLDYLDDKLEYFMKSHKESEYFRQDINYFELKLTILYAMTVDPSFNPFLKGIISGALNKRHGPDKSALAFDRIMLMLKL